METARTELQPTPDERTGDPAWIVETLDLRDVREHHTCQESSLLATEIVMTSKQYDPATREHFLECLIDDLSVAHNTVHDSLHPEERIFDSCDVRKPPRLTAPTW